MDVARKTVILAREIGLNISIDDLTIENLVPKALQDCTVAEFFAKLPKFDAEIMQDIANKKQSLAGVHYVGTIDNGIASVGIQAYDESSPFANVKGTDNIVMINTERYKQPMVIQGAGAGLAVTAAGVYADLISIIKEK
jgi:aspartokinase/homoserine dehydrogenase 1